jgi:hypothetical protein
MKTHTCWRLFLQAAGPLLQCFQVNRQQLLPPLQRQLHPEVPHCSDAWVLQHV